MKKGDSVHVPGKFIKKNYREEAVGLKNSNCTFKITIFVNM